MKIKYRREAHGRNCQVRSPVCNFDTETTILAHLNGAGMGRKHDDKIAAWSCSTCHDWLDGGYAQHSNRIDRDLHHYRGIIRTQEILIEEGKL